MALKFKTEAEFAAWQVKAGLKSVEIQLPPHAARKQKVVAGIPVTEPIQSVSRGSAAKSVVQICTTGIKPRLRVKHFAGRRLAIGVLQGLGVALWSCGCFVVMLAWALARPLFGPVAGLFTLVLLVDLIVRLGTR